MRLYLSAATGGKAFHGGIRYNRGMKRILAIETSCDETGVALWDDASGLVAHELFSQVALHAHYGGVVPELASRDHVRRLPQLVTRALAQARWTPADVDLVAYTAGPGLAGALLVGAAFAESWAFARGVPTMPIHHLEGHLLSPLMAAPDLAFPFVALLVSGGHTQLLWVEGVGRYRLLGETIDDAAGEAFDKTAKILGLGYPGGPQLAKLAEQGDATRYALPRPLMQSSEIAFSFSGLKTAVALAAETVGDDPQAKADLAASFQAAVIDVLVAKTVRAVEMTGARRLVAAGGVTANAQLRARLAAELKALGCSVVFPPPQWCTDNGAMIAHAAAQRVRLGFPVKRDYRVTIHPRWPLPL